MKIKFLIILFTLFFHNLAYPLGLVSSNDEAISFFDFYETSSDKLKSEKSLLTENILSDEGKVLGVATRICMNPKVWLKVRKALVSKVKQDDLYPAENLVLKEQYFSQFSWWITPDHVVQNRKFKIENMDGEVKIEFRRPEMDLVLLRAPLIKGECSELAMSFELKKFNNIESFLDKSLPLYFENPRERFVQEAVIHLTTANGIPGRDKTGPLLSVMSSGKLGDSGSAILTRQGHLAGMLDFKILDQTIGQHFYEYYEEPIKLTDELKSMKVNGVDIYELSMLGLSESILESRKRVGRILLGMTIAVEVKGRKLIALPAPSIYKAIWDYYETGRKKIKNTDRLSRGHYTEYLDDGLIHFRGEVVVKDAGTGSLNDGGTGSLNDGGGSFLDSDLKSFHSGILFDKKQWFAIDNIWNEYEAAPEKIRQLIKNKKSTGIYLDTSDNKLKTNSIKKSLPEWIFSDDLFKLQGLDPFYEMYTLDLMQTLSSDDPCLRVLFVEVLEEENLSRVIRGKICEKKLTRGRIISLSFHDSMSDSKIQFMAVMTSEENNEVQIEAKYSLETNQEVEKLNSIDQLDNTWKKLENSGLRVFRDEEFQFEIYKNEGVRMKMKIDGTFENVFSGPASSLEINKTHLGSEPLK